MKKPLLTLMFFASGASLSHSAILSVIETGLGGDAAAIPVDGGFAEDALTFSDRTHEHNGAAFDAGTNLLSTSGTNIVPLPSYLVGGDYVRFANNARDNSPYSAVVTTDSPSLWYLLIDNRIDAVAGNNSSPNTSDPVLGGSLQWVLDGGWTRVNTGISPDGQADYTGVDEGGDGSGAGQGLNQFYSVYTLAGASDSVTVMSNGIGGNNMISLVADAIPEPSSVGLLALAAVGLLRRRRA
ncbi:MAG: PEP-CTERM sorting domain-containing protein [Verrucomicrobiales bacterium]